ncbi:MAG: hypothetical protein F8N15_10580 [Methanobacterium sp.]|nr:hypothetical protein [Methanobacterium sp.]
MNWIELHPGTAAWVQAGGALVALIIAVCVPTWHTRKIEARKRRQFLQSVAAIGGEVQKCFTNAAAHCGHDTEQGLRFVRSVEACHRFRIASAAINAVPVHELPSYQLARRVLELQQLMAEGLMQLDAAFKEVDDHQRLVQSELYGQAFTRLAESARPCLSEIEAAAR